MDVRSRALAVRQAILNTAQGEHAADYTQAAEAIACFLAGIIFSLGKLMGYGAPLGIASVAAAGGGLNGACCLLGAIIGYLASCGKIMIYLAEKYKEIKQTHRVKASPCVFTVFSFLNQSLSKISSRILNSSNESFS